MHRHGLVKTINSGEPFLHDTAKPLRLECCGCGKQHIVKMEILKKGWVRLTFTNVKTAVSGEADTLGQG